MFSPYGNADYVIIQTNSFWNSPQSSNAKISVGFMEGFYHIFPRVFMKTIPAIYGMHHKKMSQVQNSE